jgi:hypothetical protein
MLIHLVKKVFKQKLSTKVQFKKASVKGTVLALFVLTFLAGCSSSASLGTPSDTSGQNIKSTQSQSEAAITVPEHQDTGAGNASPAPTAPKQDDSQKTQQSVIYKNTQYGFNFTLPDSWKGYTIITGKWKGQDTQSGKEEISGPMISIRHPLWTSKNPRQDIPIMVLTSDQWNLIQQGKFHIGAAPIGPSELGHNSRFVFALPARYNYAFPTGFKEVETILNGNPLIPTEN